MLRRFLVTGIIVLLLGSVPRVRTARAEPPDVIHFGPPPLAQTIQLYPPPRPDVSTSQADASHAAVIQAHLLPPDEPVSAQAPAAGGSKPTGVPVATAAAQSSTATYTATASPAPPASSEPPASSTGGAGVPGGVVVHTVLAGDCSGMVPLSVNVNDTSGNPVQGAAVAVQIELKTTTQHYDLPPTDARGYTRATVDVGSPASGFTLIWTVTATSAVGTGSSVTTCINT